MSNIEKPLFSRAAAVFIAVLLSIMALGSWNQPVAAAPTCTADCYVSPTGSDANDGATAATPLLSIQLAVNTVSNDGTVHLAAGTYSGDTMLSAEGWRELLITKPLTMLGAGSTTTFVQFREETTGIEVEGNVGGDITFQGITFTKIPANTNAAGFNIRFVEWATKSFDVVTFDDVVSEYASGRNVFLGHNGTYDEVIVTNSRFNYSGAYGFTINGIANKVTVTGSAFNYNGRLDSVHGEALALYSSDGTISNVLIKDSEFINTALVGTGIAIANIKDVTIDNVEATGNWNGIANWEWINKTSNVLIQNSAVNGNHTGILIGSETGKTVEDVAINHNDLSDNTALGVHMVRVTGWGEGVMTNVDINRNDLSGNPTMGINTELPYETVDGKCNWWGDASGPGPVGPGSGSNVSTDVTYAVWLFSNNLDGGNVENVDTGELFCSIQEAIDDSDTLDGHTIEVSPGTYMESPTVNKSVTLVSTGGRDVTFIELQTNTNYVHSLLITGAEVTVDGFTIVGIDAACPTYAATNIYLNTQPDDVIIKNNRFQVGAIDTGCTTGDDGFGIITEYSGNPDVASLTVEDNIFEPLNTAGQRAFYINPSVVDFTFSGNEINGQFDGTAITEAQNNLIEDNTLTGTGASAGFGIWGYLDPGLWGTGTFQRNTITGTANAITIYDAEDVTVTHNDLDANGRGVRVMSVVDVDFDQTTIHINRNALTNNTTNGIDNLLNPGTFGSDYIDGTCNWWNHVSGPSGEGSGSGDNVSDFVEYKPWLYSDDLNGPCYVGGTIEIKKVAQGAGSTLFEFDPSWSTTNFKLADGGSYVTSPPLPAGNYSVTEINLPVDWKLDTATCVNLYNPRIANNGPNTADPSNITVADRDEWVCTFTNVYTPPPDNVCNVQDSSAQWTDIIGAGMGNPKTHKVSVKVNIPNYTQVTSLYGQMVAKDMGKAKFVRFVMPGAGNYVQVNPITSPLDHAFGTFWYGADLVSKLPTKSVTGQWFLQASGTKGHIPRALVLYPTYNDPNKTYVNIWNT
ncbi:MAG: hypothetical protein KBF17_15425, partial [Candidatus Promineofilum sp.]|nr:hypothetical protein [Promineifilum sp.]